MTEQPVEHRRLLDLVQEASVERASFVETYRRIASIAMPHRLSWWAAGGGISAIDEHEASFPVTATTEFANRIKSGVAPVFREWVRFVPARGLTAAEHQRLARLAEPMNDRLGILLQEISAGSQIHQLLLDAGIGVGAVHIAADHGGNVFMETVPPSQLLLLPGRGDDLLFIGREREMKVRDIVATWGDAVPHEIASKNPAEKVPVVDGVLRTDWSEDRPRWTWFVGDRQTIWKEAQLEGIGSNPWVVFRWDPVPGTGWGVGPVYYAYRDMSALERLRRARVTAVEFMTNRPMLYDPTGIGAMESVEIQPGVWIPFDQTSSPPQPLDFANIVDPAILEEQRYEELIARALYLDRLGPLSGAVRSATEILERQAELSRIIGAPYGRLVDALRRIVERIVALMIRAGQITDPQFKQAFRSGMLVVEAAGPFASAERIEDANRLVQFLATAAQIVGPAGVAAAVDLSGALSTLARLMDVPPEIVRTPEQISQLLQQAQAIQQQVPGR